MTTNLAQEIAALKRMTITELRSKHIEAFGEPTRTGNKAYLIKRIAWRLQANAYGEISDRARRRAEELANDADLRRTAPKIKSHPSDDASGGQTIRPFVHGSRLPMVGAKLTRIYKGHEIIVEVRPKGFEYEGTIYRSLSAVVTAITGSHWNGYHFFNLQKNGGTHA